MSAPRGAGYGPDLAHVHDVGFGDFARRAAPGVLTHLRAAGVDRGLVVDLGCGSGLWAETLLECGYDVLGVDQSEAMIALARRRAPDARLLCASFLDVDLPPCDAITSLGECLGYLFDEHHSRRAFEALLARVWAALRPGGLLVFDLATPGMVPGGGPTRAWFEDEAQQWALLTEIEERAGRGGGAARLVRRITTFRRTGAGYRRTHEVHRLLLHRPADVAAALRRLGFRVRVAHSYGDFALGATRRAFVARRPASSRG